VSDVKASEDASAVVAIEAVSNDAERAVVTGTFSRVPRVSRAPRRVALDLRGLTGDGDIFRLLGAEKRAPAIDAWLTGEPHGLRSIAATWFERMRQCGNDVRELMHDGCPVACTEDAPFGYVNSFRNHVNVGFFYGAELDDTAALLEGSGKRMRHVKLRPGAPHNTEALRTLIEAAYLGLGQRLSR
jgi:hypothetical protein